MFNLEKKEIEAYLPHRDPFLMVDRIIDIITVGDLTDLSPKTKTGVKVIGEKTFTGKESFFKGHFPAYPVTPGVMILEVMAQVSSFTYYPYLQTTKTPHDSSLRGLSCVLLGVDKARFRKPVVPGMTVQVTTVAKKCREQLWVFECVATVDGEEVSSADIMARLAREQVLQTVFEGA